MLLLDHPLVSAFNHLEIHLHRFRVAVLPVVLAMSDADAHLLAAWVREEVGKAHPFAVCILP